MKAAGQNSSRERLLNAGKALLSQRGYEATTTAAIAKAAGTSHSQLVKHFKDKQGVLLAILEQGWQQVNPAVELAIERINQPLERLALALNMFLSAVEKDPALRAVLTLDGGALRTSSGKSLLSRGYAQFTTILDGIVDQIVLQAQLRPEINPRAVRAALIGLLEKFLRDELLRHFADTPSGYSEYDLQKIISGLLVGCLNEGQPTIAPPQEIHAGVDDEVWIRQYVGLAEKVLKPPIGEA
jgi:AcrR family transcriptional regulator